MFTLLDADQIRQKAKLARAHILIALFFSGSGHPGGSLSVIDVETALYFGVMHHDPANPFWPLRDRLFVSCQHKCPAQYCAMGLAGYFPLENFDIGLRVLGQPFQGHPDWLKLPGIEMSGGSLGQGLGVAVGSALAAKLNNEPHRIFCISSDGDHQEGSTWEAIMSAAHHKLDNLCGIVDENRLQIDGNVKDIMGIAPLDQKYASFGWNVIPVNGHDIDALLAGFEQAKNVKGKPSVLIMRTFKGNGISFMQDKYEWHGKAPNLEQTRAALKELDYEYLLTDELIAKAKALRDDVSKKYGSLMPGDERRNWWNARPDLMAVKMAPPRTGFGKALDRIGDDPRIVCLGADISSSICISDFCKNHPERNNRFLQIGVAEQNMTVVAAGLAKEGKIPVIGSYGVFVSGRNWDQLRTTVCHGELNVKIGVSHCGMSVGPDGATHQALEDISLLQILPNMTLVVPCDSIEADKATEEIVLRVKGPAAVRLAREATPIVTTPETPFRLGKANIYRFRREDADFIKAFECKVSEEYANENEKLSIVACGPEFAEALRAAYILKKEHGIETRVINMHTIKPFDRAAVIAAARDTGKIVTAEEHQKGGFGNLVAGAIAEAGVPVKIAMVGVKDSFGESGNPWELMWKYGLTAEFIVSSALNLLE